MTEENEIAKLVDVESLTAQLHTQQSTNFSSQKYGEINKLQQRDEEITNELSVMHQLWIITSTIHEIESHIQFDHWENVFHSLKIFEKKISTINDPTLRDSSLENYQKLYRSSIDRITLIWGKLLDISDNSITFNSSIETSEEEVITYETILEIIIDNKLSFPNSNTSHVIDTLLLSSLIDDSKELRLNDNKIEILDSFESSQLDIVISSVSSLVSFIQQFPNAINILNYISKRLFDWLKNSILVNNIESIYHDDTVQLKFIKLGEFLNENELKRNNELSNWIKNELNDMAIKYYLDLYIDEIRGLFKTLDEESFTHLVTRYEETEQTTTTAIATKKDTPTEKVEDDKDADWGWDDEIKFDDEEGATEEQKEDDDWDAWDDEEEKSSKKLVSKLSKSKQSNTSRESTPNTDITKTSNGYSTTELPDYVSSILQSYLKTQSRIPEEYHQVHFSKLNYLATTYFILGRKYFGEKYYYLFYNDLNHLTSSINIPRLNDLKEKYLLNGVNALETEVYQIYSKLNDLDPSLSSAKTFKIINDIDLTFQKYFHKTQTLSDENRTKLIISIIDKFFESIINSILKKQSIGEDESEYLCTIINKFLSFQTPLDPQNYKLIKNYTKLNHVSFILKSHLSEIMESFYNAEFFDLTTYELISLIDKLFADSDLKRRSIEEIKEIREADV